MFYFWPLLCSLVQWLKHSRKEYCELCKHRFAFTPSKYSGHWCIKHFYTMSCVKFSQQLIKHEGFPFVLNFWHQFFFCFVLFCKKCPTEISTETINNHSCNTFCLLSLPCFFSVYSPDMPSRLPIQDICAGLLTSVGTAIRYWFHYTLVAFAWLGVVPLTACKYCRPQKSRH